MVSQGSFMPVFTRPVALILFLIIVWIIFSQFQIYRSFKTKLVDLIMRRKPCETIADEDADDN